MRSEGFSDVAFAQLADLSHVLAGLAFPPNRQPSAETGMRRAMAALHISSPSALLEAARVPGQVRDVVLAELTVGESYFSRDASQFGVLASEIIPRLMQRPVAERTLRVWSAGCASGEEPYTVAITLRELGWSHPVRILGTDIALPRLAAARRGRYTRWALRGVLDQRVERWFTRRENYFDLDPSIRDSVEFRQLNLVHDDYPRDAGGGGFDLILCRNVMIYFDLATVTRVAAGLLESLAPDGWLVLGASDPALTQLLPCEWVMTAGGVAYRKAGRNGTTHPRAHAEPEWPRAVPTIVPVPRRVIIDAPVPAVTDDRSARKDARLAYDRAEYPLAEALAIRALSFVEPPEECAALWVLYIRCVANQGRVTEAGEICTRALEAHPLAAELYHLHATLLVEEGWHADAVIAIRRAIYLDRAFVMAHLLLGDVLAKTGDTSGARKAFRNVIALLEHADPALPVPAADGVPLKRLRQIANVRIQTLPTEFSR